MDPLVSQLIDAIFYGKSVCRNPVIKVRCLRQNKEHLNRFIREKPIRASVAKLKKGSANILNQTDYLNIKAWEYAQNSLRLV